MNFECVIKLIVDWVQTELHVHAIALVGSLARGLARENSDIDLVLLVTDPLSFRVETAWFAAIGIRPVRWRDEDYGAVWSRRVWLEDNGGEIEFSFALPTWADVDPIDPGTLRVMSGGYRILCDPNAILSRLDAAVT